ncbi:MAG: DUF1858 domain-containing protein [Oscillospiraceae bacterium]|jgi:hybrid cluster-associated redox disulfide protein
MVVDKNSIIGDIISFDQETAGIFIKNGMFCVGCPASWGETIEQASMVHGIDPQELIDMLNAYLASKEPSGQAQTEEAEKA